MDVGQCDQIWQHFKRHWPFFKIFCKHLNLFWQCFCNLADFQRGFRQTMLELGHLLFIFSVKLAECSAQKYLLFDLNHLHLVRCWKRPLRQLHHSPNTNFVQYIVQHELLQRIRYQATFCCFKSSCTILCKTYSTLFSNSVTRFGDLLDFGELFKSFGNNQFAQISHILRQFL